MLGTAPGNSVPGLVGEVLAAVPVAELAGAAAAAGSSPAACAIPADNSSELMRTSPAPSPSILGCASWFTFSWKDCALAAVAVAPTAGATGAGRLSTSTSVKIEMARVAILMMRCHFTKGPPNGRRPWVLPSMLLPSVHFLSWYALGLAGLR